METILVGVDGSERSADALALARRLAQPTDRLLLVCAYPADPIYAGEGGPDYPRALRADAEATLRRLSGSPGTVTRAVADSHPARALQTVAAEERAALIVVGSSHTGPLRRVFPGSTGEHLLHGAPCPVTIAPLGYRDHADAPFALVACAYDGSPEARCALIVAERVALRLAARLRIVEVIAPRATEYGGASENLRSVVDGLDPAVRATRTVLYGDAAEELVRASFGVDLMVLGSRGYGPLHAVLTGAVSGRVIRAAACPTMVVPRMAQPAQTRGVSVGIPHTS